jgi:hypothetical protein
VDGSFVDLPKYKFVEIVWVDVVPVVSFTVHSFDLAGRALMIFGF